LAFLLKDLDMRGRRDLAGRFLAAYQQQVDDPDFVDLLPFYKSYRAWVRGKVDALLAGETEVAAETRAEALARSRRSFNLALGYHLPPMLLLTAGLMGVGKTTLARAFTETVGAELLRSDVIRKELAGISPEAPCPEGFGRGLYSETMTSRTYAELQYRADRLLRQGKTVVVDASFACAAERQQFFTLSERRAVPARLLHLQCDRSVAMTRLDRRQANGRDASDGRRELLDTQSAAFDPVPCDPRVITIDSSPAVDYTVHNLICRLLAR
jgi:predicted kinase